MGLQTLLELATIILVAVLIVVRLVSLRRIP